MELRNSPSISLGRLPKMRRGDSHASSHTVRATVTAWHCTSRQLQLIRWSTQATIIKTRVQQHRSAYNIGEDSLNRSDLDCGVDDNLPLIVAVKLQPNPQRRIVLFVSRMCGERNNVQNPHMQSIHVSMLNLESTAKILYFSGGKRLQYQGLG